MDVLLLQDSVLLEVFHHLFPHLVHDLHHLLLHLLFALVKLLVDARLEEPHKHKLELLPAPVERVVALDEQQRVDRLKSEQSEGQLQNRGLRELGKLLQKEVEQGGVSCTC